MITSPAIRSTEPPDSTAADPSRSLGVYDRLRWDIVHGVLRPNEALIEGELSARLGVSRTPVRESLLRLAADGLIVSRRRRWYVYEHTAAEVGQLYELRAALEGFAARLACARAGTEQLDRIESAVAVVDAAEPTERVRHNDTFHDLINDASGNQQLTAAIGRTRVFHFNRRLAAGYTPEMWAASSAQHAAIARAVADREPELAERLVREHVMDAAGIAARLLGCTDIEGAQRT